MMNKDIVYSRLDTVCVSAKEIGNYLQGCVDSNKKADSDRMTTLLANLVRSMVDLEKTGFYDGHAMIDRVENPPVKEVQKPAAKKKRKYKKKPNKKQ